MNNLGFMRDDIVSFKKAGKNVVGLVLEVMNFSEGPVKAVDADGTIYELSIDSLNLISGLEFEDYNELFKKHFKDREVPIATAIPPNSYFDNYGFDSFMSMGNAFVAHPHHNLQPVNVGDMTVYLSSAGQLTKAEIEEAPFVADLFVCLETGALSEQVWFNGFTSGITESLYQDTVYIPWHDYGVVDKSTIHKAILVILEQMKEGNTVEIGCMAGHGRTGTLTSCLIMEVERIGPTEAVKALKTRYCDRVVDTDKQNQLIIDYWREYIKTPDMPDIKDIPIYTPPVSSSKFTVILDEDKSLPKPKGLVGVMGKSGNFINLGWTPRNRNDKRLTGVIVEGKVGNGDFVRVAETAMDSYMDFYSLSSTANFNSKVYRIRYTSSLGKVSQPSTEIQVEIPEREEKK